MPWEFHQIHHPSYIDFYEQVLADTTDPRVYAALLTEVTSLDLQQPFLDELEQAAGRTRDVRWGPRTLDVDVVTVDSLTSDDPELLLPHPRTAERAFVLRPWLDVEPDAVLPGHGPVAALLAALGPHAEDGLHRRDDLDLR